MENQEDQFEHLRELDRENQEAIERQKQDDQENYYDLDLMSKQSRLMTEKLRIGKDLQQKLDQLIDSRYLHEQRADEYECAHCDLLANEAKELQTKKVDLDYKLKSVANKLWR